MSDFKHLDNIYVRFGPHPVADKAHSFMNAYYAGNLPNLNSLFTDDDRTSLKGNVLELIRDHIVDGLISPAASQTEDKSTILPIINAAAFKVSSHPSNATRLTPRSLADAVRSAVTMKKVPCTIDITIQIGHIYFKHQPVTYLDWSAFTTEPVETPMPTRATTPTPPTSVDDLTAALTRALASARTDPAEIASAVTTAIRATPPAPAASTHPSAHIFNVTALPDDVRERWERRQQQKVILGSTVSTPFDSGFYYYLDGTERLFLSDGTLFIIQDRPDEKALLRDPVTCKNDTHQGIRSWYETFVRHAMDHGFYVHPLYCFQKDHGGAWGFSIWP